MHTRRTKWIKGAVIAAVVLAVFLLLIGLDLLDPLFNGILDVFMGMVSGFLFLVSRFVEFVNWLAEVVSSWF